MKAIVSVIGKDNFGILARVASVCSDNRANIIDVTQSVLQDMFVMIMLVDISAEGREFSKLCGDLDRLGDQINMKINIMHEDIFNSMHRI